jgi:hypothetical protein
MPIISSLIANWAPIGVYPAIPATSRARLMRLPEYCRFSLTRMGFWRSIPASRRNGGIISGKSTLKLSNTARAKPRLHAEKDSPHPIPAAHFVLELGLATILQLIWTRDIPDTCVSFEQLKRFTVSHAKHNLNPNSCCQRMGGLIGDHRTLTIKESGHVRIRNLGGIIFRHLGAPIAEMLGRRCLPTPAHFSHSIASWRFQ